MLEQELAKRLYENSAAEGRLMEQRDTQHCGRCNGSAGRQPQDGSTVQILADLYHGKVTLPMIPDIRAHDSEDRLTSVRQASI